MQMIRPDEKKICEYGYGICCRIATFAVENALNKKLRIKALAFDRLNDGHQKFSGPHTLVGLTAEGHISRDDYGTQVSFCEIVFTRNIRRFGPQEQAIFTIPENVLISLDSGMICRHIAAFHDLFFSNPLRIADMILWTILFLASR